jgi:hypothetical protein
MAYATGATSKLSYIAEVTFGTTPGTPQMVEIPMVSTTLDLTKSIINDPTIIADRMERDEKHGNKTTGGNLAVTLQHSQFDDFIEAACGGTWATNALKVAGATGGVERSYTVEQAFTNVTQNRVFTGVRVNTLDIAGAINSYVTATFGLIGKGMSTSSVALDLTPTALQAKAGLTMLNGVLSVGGVAATVTAFNLNLNNNMGALYGVTSDTAVGINWAESNLTGSLTFYFEDLVQYNRFLNETTAALIVTATDGTNTITFTLPKVKFNSATLPVSGAGVLFLTMSFKALYDTGSATTMTVTRT